MKPKSHGYITTAIDYANGAPHMGHALEKIGGDVMARYRRRKGEAVHYVIGMDEHGLKVLQSAEERGISPQAWVDELAAEFQDVWGRLEISHDDFIRTTQDRHHAAAQEMVRRLQEADDLYTDTYAGYYCVGCEAYKTEDELEAKQAGSEQAAPLTGEQGPERAAGLQCPLHPNRSLEWMEEENWFFRLSRYQDRLLDLLDERPEFVQPESRRNEVRRMIESGLEDISVSRARLPWGVPWPGNEEHVLYVWLDALSNYLSAVGFPEDGFQDYWPADFHVVGKDITRFHCVYWPAFLMSAGLPLPATVWAHGFINFGGGKMSKSAGVTASLDDAIARHGPDALRYYLMRDVPWNGDGDFAWDRFDDVYTAELANDLGNLASRSLSMIERYRDGAVPTGDQTELDRRILAEMQRDASQSLDEIARRVGSSKTPVWNRVRRLREAGVIGRQTVELDAEALGFDACFFVLIRTAEHDAEWQARFLGALRARPEVQEAHRLAGDVDYILKVRVANARAYDAFYQALIAEVRIHNVTALLSMEEIKATIRLPL